MTLRLVSYQPLNPACPQREPLTGALLDDGVLDLSALAENDCPQRPNPLSVLGVLSCPNCRQQARELVAAGEGQRLALDEVRLLAPAPRPGKMFCVAGNYEAHIRESRGKNLSGEVHKSDSSTPRIFMKPATNTVCGHGDPIWVTRQSHFVDYEGELAVIIGRRAKYLSPEEALECVAGVTICNDISERQLHIWDRPEDRPWDRFFDWLNGKWGDNFAPLGPCAVPLEDLPDLQNLPLRTRLNGEVMQEATTADMIFTVAQLLSYLSQMLTLEAGDIIATGTPSGVGIARGVAMQPGDTVEVEIEGIGVLRNPVVAEEQ